MLEVVIVSDVYPSLPCRIPTHVALLCSEPFPGAIGITTGTTSCTAKSSLFIIEFIACFRCGGYALSHIPQAFLRYDSNHKATIRF